MGFRLSQFILAFKLTMRSLNRLIKTLSCLKIILQISSIRSVDTCSDPICKMHEMGLFCIWAFFSGSVLQGALSWPTTSLASDEDGINSVMVSSAEKGCFI